MSWTLPSQVSGQVIEWNSAGSSMNDLLLFILDWGRKFILVFLGLYLIFYAADHKILPSFFGIAARVNRKALRWFQSSPPTTAEYSCYAPFRTLILHASVPSPSLFNICTKLLGNFWDAMVSNARQYPGLCWPAPGQRIAGWNWTLERHRWCWLEEETPLMIYLAIST